MKNINLKKFSQFNYSRKERYLKSLDKKKRTSVSIKIDYLFGTDQSTIANETFQKNKVEFLPTINDYEERNTEPDLLMNPVRRIPRNSMRVSMDSAFKMNSHEFKTNVKKESENLKHLNKHLLQDKYRRSSMHQHQRFSPMKTSMETSIDKRDKHTHSRRDSKHNQSQNSSSSKKSGVKLNMNLLNTELKSPRKLMKKSVEAKNIDWRNKSPDPSNELSGIIESPFDDKGGKQDSLYKTK